MANTVYRWRNGCVTSIQNRLGATGSRSSAGHDANLSARSAANFELSPRPSSEERGGFNGLGDSAIIILFSPAVGAESDMRDMRQVDFGIYFDPALIDGLLERLDILAGVAISAS